MTFPTLLPHPSRLIEIGPHAGAHRVAARAGLSLGIPLVALALTGHLELSLYSVFGAFTALYGRTHAHVPRLRMQATAGAALVLTVTLGAAIGVSPAREWIVVPVAAVVAGVGTFLAAALHWHPPGALFFVFALAGCASVPATPPEIFTAFVLAAASAALAMVISAIGLLRPSARRSLDVTLPPATRRPVRTAFAAAVARPGQARAVALVAIAVLIAGAIPTATGLGHPYWAMVSAVAALGAADATGHLVRAGHRVLGTLVGVVFAGAILAFGTNTLMLIAVVILLQVGAELFVMRNYGITMVFVTPLALIMTQLAHPQPLFGVLRDRLLETLIGAAVAIALSVTAALVAHRRSALG
jgi:uncharacterized membrane protein